jgi:phosphoribosylamine---glycine ligase
MNILLIGNGGREHAIAGSLIKSSNCSELFVSPGNAGTDEIATNLDGNSIADWIKIVIDYHIDLTIVGPEQPLVDGIVDVFRARHYPIVGPTKNASQLEGSKRFSKEFMMRHNIPTARYEVFQDADLAKHYLKDCNEYPIVIKADGLAAGKGVLIPENEIGAMKAIDDIMVDKAFGNAGREVVIEEFMTGIECSALVFTDGVTIKPMVSAKDYKRALEGDLGLNTGGMGAISPNPNYSIDVEDAVMNTILMPTIRGMASEGNRFQGILYLGLMLTEFGPKVVEYNVRFGDPETQVILPRLETDLLEIFWAIEENRLESLDIKWKNDVAATVVLASGGYPGKYEKGYPINGIDSQTESIIFHAGTLKKGGYVVTNGGRVIAVTSLAETIGLALKKSYEAIDKIEFTGKIFRHDIGS